MDDVLEPFLLGIQGEQPDTVQNSRLGNGTALHRDGSRLVGNCLRISSSQIKKGAELTLLTMRIMLSEAK